MATADVIDRNTGGVTDLVAQGAAIIRIENETMMQVAVQRPRDEQAVVTGALRELDLVPEEAGKAFYSIPYKERQPDGTVKIVKIEGPSIKAAMALGRRWGNCSNGARVLNEDKEGFDLEGVFIDLETNFRTTRPQRVSKWYKSRAGGAQLLSIDRQLMALQAGASKAIRNATLAGLPAYLVSAYDKKARAIVGGNLDAPADQKTVNAVLRAFEKLRVTKAQLEDYAELPTEKWTGSEVADLRGLWNAISDGQTNVEEVFGAGTTATGTPGASTGAATVTPENLAGATVTGEDNAQHEPQQPPVTTQEDATPGPGADERAALISRIRTKLNGMAKKTLDMKLEQVGLRSVDELQTADYTVLGDLAKALGA